MGNLALSLEVLLKLLLLLDNTYKRREPTRKYFLEVTDYST